MTTNKKSIEAEFDKEFDWRELQYDEVMYVPTKSVKSFFFSQISKILDEMVPEEKKLIVKDKMTGVAWASEEAFGFNSCRQDILNKIKEYAGN